MAGFHLEVLNDSLQATFFQGKELMAPGAVKIMEVGFLVQGIKTAGTLMVTLYCKAADQMFLFQILESPVNRGQVHFRGHLFIDVLGGKGQGVSLKQGEKAFSVVTQGSGHGFIQPLLVGFCQPDRGY